MKYCVDYFNHTKGLENADEYTIKYNKQNDALITFLQKNQNKTINLKIEERLDDIDYQTLKVIYNTFSNFKLRFELYNPDDIENIIECGIPFFFANRVNSWDLFLGLIDLGVTDIYIVEDMCFDLERVSEVAHRENVKLRTYANVAQSTWADSDGIKKFWIRPEDIQIYEQYIDVLEFFGNPQQCGVLLNIYKINKQWYGPLEEIIIGLNNPIDSRYIVPEFAEKRVSCQKQCLKGGKCKICNRVVELSKVLKEAQLTIVPKKK